MSLKSFIQNTILLFFDICFPLVSLHFCDTFPALSRGNFNAASGMLQTRLKPNQKYFKKERNIP